MSVRSFCKLPSVDSYEPHHSECKDVDQFLYMLFVIHRRVLHVRASVLYNWAQEQGIAKVLGAEKTLTLNLWKLE